MSKTRLEAVLFDYGHTLVDFTVPEDALHDVYGRIRLRLVEEANVELPAAPELVELVARRVTRAVDASYGRDRLLELDILALFEEALGALGFTPSAETVRWVAEVEHRALSAHLVSPPEIIATIAAIHDAGLKIGVVSNAHLLPDLMRENWMDLGFGQFVDASVISSEIGKRKPHPAIFEAALRELGVAPAAALFVGDRALDDVGGAHQMGMRAVLTTEFSGSTGRAASEEEAAALLAEKPELVVDSLPQILPYVMSLIA